jgi:2-polyprenyl-3-methyl-5-hydroxy-6-metoxy-1,4-benzoquinol methylase
VPDYDSPYERQRERLLRAMLPTGEGTAVDIGCNDGRFTALLSEAGYDPVVGYDTDERVLELAKAAHPSIDFRLGHEDFSITGRALTVALELIEHIPPAAQLGFLRSIRTATAPGGLLFLSTPGRYSILATYERLRQFKKYRVEAYTWWDSTHVGVLSYSRLRRLLDASGFAVQRRAGFCFAPPHRFRPRAAHGPLGRAGFDLIVVAHAA